MAVRAAAPAAAGLAAGKPGFGLRSTTAGPGDSVGITTRRPLVGEPVPAPVESCVVGRRAGWSCTLSRRAARRRRRRRAWRPGADPGGGGHRRSPLLAQSADVVLRVPGVVDRLDLDH